MATGNNSLFVKPYSTVFEKQSPVPCSFYLLINFLATIVVSLTPIQFQAGKMTVVQTLNVVFGWTVFARSVLKAVYEYARYDKVSIID